MRLHPSEYHIQIAATACLYNLTKGEIGQKIHPRILKDVVHCTLAAMENFPNNLQVSHSFLLLELHFCLIIHQRHLIDSKDDGLRLTEFISYPNYHRWYYSYQSVCFSPTAAKEHIVDTMQRPNTARRDVRSLPMHSPRPRLPVHFRWFFHGANERSYLLNTSRKDIDVGDHRFRIHAQVYAQALVPRQDHHGIHCRWWSWPWSEYYPQVHPQRLMEPYWYIPAVSNHVKNSFKIHLFIDQNFWAEQFLLHNWS